MKRNSFSEDEVVLCAYAAMYDVNDFGGTSMIEGLKNRSQASIKMKIQNIAAMLDHFAIPRSGKESPLTGRPHGQTGRTTNWETVEPLTRLTKKAFLQRCQSILK